MMSSVWVACALMCHSGRLDNHWNADSLQLPFSRRRGTNLATLFDETHIRIGFIAVDEMAEALARVRIVDSLFHSHS